MDTVLQLGAEKAELHGDLGGILGGGLGSHPWALVLRTLSGHTHFELVLALVGGIAHLPVTQGDSQVSLSASSSPISWLELCNDSDQQPIWRPQSPAWS